MHRFITAARYSLGASLFSAIITRADDEPLGIIELDTNLADVEKPLELPAGNYTGEIQDVQIGTSQKGNQYFNVKFVIAPDEIPSDVAEQFEDGATLYYNRIIVPGKSDRRALWNLRKFIEAIGLDSKSSQIDPNEWMGMKARLKVTHGSWQGETRAEIKSVESAEAPVSKKAEEKPAPKTRARR
jgi:hypothetical protein